MKWLTLSLSALPLIAIQADSVIQKYSTLKNRVSSFGRNEDISQLNQIHCQIKRRIQALDHFYQKYYLDNEIHLFHMIKIKLQRAVFISDTIDNGTIEFSMINSQRDSKQTHLESESILEDPFFTNKSHQNQDEKSFGSKFSSQRNPYNLSNIRNSNPYEKQKQVMKKKINSQFSDEQGLSTYKPHKIFPDKVNPMLKKKGTEPLTGNKQNFKQQQKKNNKSGFDVTSFKKKSNNSSNYSNLNKDKINISSYVAKNQSKSRQKSGQKEQSKSPDSKSQTNSRIGVNINTSNINSKNVKYSGIKYGNKQRVNTQPEQRQQIYEQSQDQSSQQMSKKPNQLLQNSSEFRFTIKMTKQQYKKLLQMKRNFAAQGNN